MGGVVYDEFAQLHYRVLGHLDLRGGRGNLYDPAAPERPWVGRLAEAYRETSDPMLVQVLPLVLLGGDEGGADAEKAVAFLESKTGDERLAGALGEAYEDVAAREGMEVGGAGDVIEDIREPLARLRETLWTEAGEAAPPLTLVDVPALATADGWTRGRACTVEGRRVVAVALQVPAERALVQIFHEEVHPVTDPAVEEASGGRASAIESVAVEVGEAVVEAVAPGLIEVYREWRTR